ncbi:LacI family DNA-binding transcriptional regulator [Cellulomonas endophytica]|uniref:LacI family DNA-binding transcriptional regulator n=1 Tax=Cellulomonas endophytica TaxID=2494735 RepID=UPI0010117CB5|nr:LacI family DNA-binding transcriptional regulator [Cellulomonas endophytica]
MSTPTTARRRSTGPSIEDVARLAGVSAQTVSRVANGAAAVRPVTRDRVLEAMGQLGYSPNRVARALRSGRFGTIGLLAHAFDRTGEAGVTEAVLEAAELEDYTVTLIHVRAPGAADWVHAARRLSQRAVDGLVIIRAEESTPETLVLPPGLPVVASYSRLVGHYPAVAADQVQGVRDAVDHLLGLGHRTVHHVAGPASSEPAMVRTGAWRRRLQEAGLTPPPPWPGDWTPRSGYAAGQRIAQDPDVTAVLCANDETAFGLVRALHEHGRRVPQDVSVVGFDGIALSEYSAPPLTTVQQDFHRIGRELVDLLLVQIRGTGTPGLDPVMVPTRLVVRASSGPPPA